MSDTFPPVDDEAMRRRAFLKEMGMGFGSVALAGLMNRDSPAAASRGARRFDPTHFAPKAKRVIYLHMAGSPPQQELFDEKPELVKHNMQPCPDELLEVLKTLTQ